MRIRQTQLLFWETSNNSVSCRGAGKELFFGWGGRQNPPKNYKNIQKAKHLDWGGHIDPSDQF